MLLKKIGLNDKEAAVFASLLELGPSPVREVARKANVNRGTAYDVLRALIKQGLVSYFDTKTHQHFVAEPPEKLLGLVSEKQESLKVLKKQIEESLPELSSAFKEQGGRPVVKMYEGKRGVRTILEDVLNTFSKSKQKVYYVYSSSTVRKNVYEAMPDFSQQRIANHLKVSLQRLRHLRPARQTLCRHDDGGLRQLPIAGLHGQQSARQQRHGGRAVAAVRSRCPGGEFQHHRRLHLAFGIGHFDQAGASAA